MKWETLNLSSYVLLFVFFHHDKLFSFQSLIQNLEDYLTLWSIQHLCTNYTVELLIFTPSSNISVYQFYFHSPAINQILPEIILTTTSPCQRYAVNMSNTMTIIIIYLYYTIYLEIIIILKWVFRATIALYNLCLLWQQHNSLLWPLYNDSTSLSRSRLSACVWLSNTISLFPRRLKSLLNLEISWRKFSSSSSDSVFILAWCEKTDDGKCSQR